MKFKSKGIYYIPDLVNSKNYGIDEYRIKGMEAFGSLYLAIDQATNSIVSLLNQYPRCFLEDEIERLLEFQYSYAKNRGVDPECCYQYYALRTNKLSQGIMVKEPIYPELVPIKLTTTEFMKGKPNFQRKMEFVYDRDSDYLIPQEVIELEQNNGIVIQSSIHPKVLRKEQRHMSY